LTLSPHRFSEKAQDKVLKMQLSVIRAKKMHKAEALCLIFMLIYISLIAACPEVLRTSGIVPRFRQLR
ncbi:MAG: hypothetical protein MJ113_01990, partial [Lachnospiraceae bacterium]|nr:hypothetical protein [Lachnospiraceae bacterium]